MRVSTVLASTGRSSLRVSTVLARRRSRSRSGLGSCGGCCASNGAIFRHPGCPLVLFVLTETVIEYAGRRAARYGAAMRQHVREGPGLLACSALPELILSEALPSRLCSDGSCSRAGLRTGFPRLHGLCTDVQLVMTRTARQRITLSCKKATLVRFAPSSIRRVILSQKAGR